MNHLEEDQLVLYYYGEAPPADGMEEHLGVCDACRTKYRTLQRVLNTVDGFPVPERAADYEAKVWASVEGKMGGRRSLRFWHDWRPLAIALVTAALVAAAFLGGRELQKAKSPALRWPIRPRSGSASCWSPWAIIWSDPRWSWWSWRTRALRRKGGWIFLTNRARRRIWSKRTGCIVRTASSVGDTGTASVLDDLERTLLEIAHSPSSLSAKELEDLRKQIEDQGILFKVKIFGSEVRQRESAPPSVGS